MHSPCGHFLLQMGSTVTWDSLPQFTTSCRAFQVVKNPRSSGDECKALGFWLSLVEGCIQLMLRCPNKGRGVIKEWDFAAQSCCSLVYRESGPFGSIFLKITIFSLSAPLNLVSERLISLVKWSSLYLANNHSYKYLVFPLPFPPSSFLPLFLLPSLLYTHISVVCNL